MLTYADMERQRQEGQEAAAEVGGQGEEESGSTRATSATRRGQAVVSRVGAVRFVGGGGVTQKKDKPRFISAAKATARRAGGAQFTCFTGTIKVQILTLRAQRQPRAARVCAQQRHLRRRQRAKTCGFKTLAWRRVRDGRTTPSPRCRLGQVEERVTSS
jgi:hypothetical protein